MDESIMHAEMEQLMLTHSTEDFREGMRAWFEKTHGLPFEGTLIQWAPMSPSETVLRQGDDDAE